MDLTFSNHLAHQSQLPSILSTQVWSVHLCLCSLHNSTGVCARTTCQQLYVFALLGVNCAQKSSVDLAFPVGSLYAYVSCNTSYLTYCNNVLLGGLHRVKVRAEKHDKHNIRWVSNWNINAKENSSSCVSCFFSVFVSCSSSSINADGVFPVWRHADQASSDRGGRSMV